MPFLPPNQQHQSTEGFLNTWYLNLKNVVLRAVFPGAVVQGMGGASVVDSVSRGVGASRRLSAVVVGIDFTRRRASSHHPPALTGDIKATRSFADWLSVVPTTTSIDNRSSFVRDSLVLSDCCPPAAFWYWRVHPVTREIVLTLIIFISQRMVAVINKHNKQLEGKYSLESTDPRESKFAPTCVRNSLLSHLSWERITYLLICCFVYIKRRFVYSGKFAGLRRFWTVKSTSG